MAWLGGVAFTLQIYFDFSGYSDMAIGLGRMLGFEFPENFNYPFISKSIREYWGRWHISMASWFRDYVFFPLGGSRGSTSRIYLNLVVLFFVVGLWHGASWTFVAWGLFHCAFLIFERLGFGKVLDRSWSPLAHLYLTLVSVGSKVIFRSQTMEQAWVFMKSMFGFAPGDGSTWSAGLYWTPELMLLLAVAVLGCTPAMRNLGRWLDAREAAGRATLPGHGLPVLRLAALALVLLFAIGRLASVSYTPFIYFRF